MGPFLTPQCKYQLTGSLKQQRENVLRRVEIRGICCWHTRDFVTRRLDIEKKIGNRPLHVQHVQRTKR